MCRKVTFRFTIYPRLDPLEPARGTSRKQQAFHVQISRVHCLLRNRRVSWCLQSVTIFAAGVQIANMLSLPLPIHLLDRLLDFGVTFSSGLTELKSERQISPPWNAQWRDQWFLPSSAGSVLLLQGERATIKPGPGHYKLLNLADRLVKSQVFWVVVDADDFVSDIFQRFFQRFRHLKIDLELGRCRLGKLLAVNCRGSCVVERVLLTVNSGWDFFQDSSLSPLAPYRHRMARNAYPDKEQPARWKFGQEPRGLLPT